MFGEIGLAAIVGNEDAAHLADLLPAQKYPAG